MLFPKKWMDWDSGTCREISSLKKAKWINMREWWEMETTYQWTPMINLLEGRWMKEKQCKWSSQYGGVGGPIICCEVLQRNSNKYNLLRNIGELGNDGDENAA